MNDEILNTSVGENIKNFRNWRGITQQELADYLDRSKSVISNWEHGTNSPDVESCRKMCKLLNVTPNELLGWEMSLEYAKFIEDQQAYQDELETLRNRAAELNAQIKDLEDKKDKKIPRPAKAPWILKHDNDDLPFN